MAASIASYRLFLTVLVCIVAQLESLYLGFGLANIIAILGYFLIIRTQDRSESYLVFLAFLVFILQEFLLGYFVNIESSLIRNLFPTSDTFIADTIEFFLSEIVIIYIYYNRFGIRTEDIFEESEPGTSKEAINVQDAGTSIDIMETKVAIDTASMEDVTIENDPTNEIDQELFANIFSRYSQIKISKLAQLLRIEPLEVERWLMTLPSDYGFIIEDEMIHIDQSQIGTVIEDLFSSFEKIDQRQKLD